MVITVMPRAKPGEKMKIVSGLLLFLLSSAAHATNNKCENLAQELKAMQQAQHQLLESRAAKGELLSETMDQHAAQLEKILASSHQIKRGHIQNLRLSAKAFRGHENREAQLIQRFEKASDQLLDQVQACLSSKGELATVQ